MKTLEPELLVDSHHGIFTMKIFSLEFNDPSNFINYSEIKKDLDYLSNEKNMDNENYLYSWEFVLYNARLINKDGVTGYLYQNEDLYFVPDEYNNEDFFNI